VDARTIEKYEKEAKEKNRDSWFLAFIMVRQNGPKRNYQSPRPLTENRVANHASGQLELQRDRRANCAGSSPAPPVLLHHTHG